MAQRDKMLTAALNSHPHKHSNKTLNCPRESSAVTEQHSLRELYGSYELRTLKYKWKTGNFNTKMRNNIRILQWFPTWGTRTPRDTNEEIQGYTKKNWIRAEKGTYVNIEIWNNGNYINCKHFVNMKGTIYGNRLPRGTQVEDVWEPLAYYSSG
jgi:hypothetical protein